MPAGRPPKPIKFKVLKGNPGRRPLPAQPDIPPRTRVPAPPQNMGRDGRREWRRVAKILVALGLLTDLDMTLFRAYCHTYNKWYEAEVSISPDGEWIVFGRQIDGKMNLWRMRPDGTDEQQITFTDDWQEGAPFYLPDNETIIFRAWRTSVKDKLREELATKGTRRATPPPI